MSDFSVVSSVVADGTGHPCVTCRARFSSVEKAKEHYRGDWHVFNSKRRASNLAPLGKEEFKKLGITLNNRNKSKSPASTPPSSSSSPSKAKAPAQLSWGGVQASTVEELKTLATKLGVGEDRMEGIIELALVRQEQQQLARAAKSTAVVAAAPAAAATSLPPRRGERSGEAEAEDEEGKDGEEEEEEDEDEDEELPPLGANVSIFDDKVFDTVEECVQYMKTRFGFYVPDTEYLQDLEGFLCYLGEKVKLGGVCLYCQKQLRPHRPCQAHMVSKSHCKVRYEEDVDLDEYEDFYDFTASYEDMPLDENGDPVSATASLSAIGELVLPDGRVAGHRDFRVYYKQYFPSAREEHPGVLAQQREELARLGIMLDGSQKTYDRQDIVAMPDTQVMTLLVKYHKEVRRNNMVQQRAKQHLDFVEKRKENRNRAQQQLGQVRKNEVHNRDYHSRLV